MDRTNLMKYFRSDDYIEDLSEDDKFEIALACVAQSDLLYNLVSNAIDLYRQEA